MGLSMAVVAILALPLIFLITDAQSAGWSQLSALLFRSLTLQLLFNTVRLAAIVTALCAVIGTAAAWFIERTDLPLRQVWAVLIVLPLAIPDFLLAFGWVSIAPWVTGFWGATLVMTVGLFPLVFLPVSASFRGADPAQEEIARSLGRGQWYVFWHVTVRQALPAILGGCLLVSLPLLAEYGAFEMLRFQTFTTTIFSEFQVSFDAAGACALSIVLVGLGFVILAAEMGVVSRFPPGAPPKMRSRATVRRRLGPAGLGVMLGFVILAALGLGMPLGVTIYWLTQGGRSTLPATATVGTAAMTTIAYSAIAATLATIAAVPLALLVIRYPRAGALALERVAYAVLSLPGLVIALAFIFISTRYFSQLYQSSFLLVCAYGVLFFPYALVSIKASVARVPVGLEQVARSLGVGRWAVFRRVTLPLILPGVAAGFCLVFLLSATEVTTTLLLIPASTETLSTQFWAFSQDVSYSAAAPYAMAMILIAILPGYILSRWFNLHSARMA
jgi:iron(III) transport system permease protein